MTGAATKRTEMVADEIRRRIAARRLLPGEKLPSIRALAGALNVSPSTVAVAYDALVADGLIRSRPGAGFYTAGAPPVPFDLSGPQPRVDRAIDPLWVSRQSLDNGTQIMKPGCGWLPADWLPHPILRRAMRELSKAEPAVLEEYGPSHGSLGLRRLLSRRLAEEGIDARADSILLTASGTQAIDLICRYLLRPDDTVLIDDPCYFNFQAMLRAHRVTPVGIPYTRNGPDPEAFVQALTAFRPRLYITNSALHNPTGATMAPQVAHRLLMAAAAHELVIVEDDIFSELEPEPSVRLASLDGLSRVIRIGSFSKTLSASIRCGYIAARPEWIEGLVDLQVATSFGGPNPLAAELVLGVLSDGSYRKHMDGLRRRLSRARREIGAKLTEIGIDPWIQPRGGFYLWCRLPAHVDAADLARRAIEQNVVLAPGNVFSADQSSAGFMRFNVAQMSDPGLFRMLANLIG